ncbi:hypothetical protein ACDW_44540 (plasmid) [Acidovorax sp. DW039]|uniref:choice-of-anchor U domain-containing protein n=1 Tax=Acidovorax sp. DW039 TaxID=3095606 RepID=UPI00308F9A99|nr:hypothetical protein ACDW_44540 [Acidovorax sp. DW039]
MHHRFSPLTRCALRIAAWAATLLGGTAQAAMTVTPSSVSAGMATLTLNSTSAGTGSWVLLRSGSCGSAAQTQAGVDGSGNAAYSKGSLALAANTSSNYTVRRLLQSQAYTVCATNGSDTVSSSFTTQAMAAYNSPAWQVVGTAGFSAGMASNQSLTFAPDGTPYVAYQDGGNSSKTTVMRFDGTAWQVVGTAGFSAGDAQHQSLAFAPDGMPYVAYRDGGAGGKTKVTRFDGAVWQVVGDAAGFSAGDAQYQSLAFAPDGTPHVAYTDYGNSGRTTVTRFDGTAWQVVGTAGFSAGYAYNQSLAFAPDGTPHVAYQDSVYGGKTVVMRFDGTAWQAVGTAGFSAGNAQYQSLAFAPDGTPYVAYQDGGNSSKTTVMSFDGTAWQVVGTAGFSAGYASYQSLAFAPDGSPYVAYSDYGNGGKATVMRFDGTTWQAVGTAGFSADNAASQSLAVAPDGTPYVAYTDYGAGTMTTVMRLTGTASAPTGLAAVVGNGAVTLSWTAPASNGGSAIQSYAVTGTPAGGGATVSCPAPVTTTTCTVSGLTNGVSYTFTVTATNAAGSSNPSSAVSATPQWSQPALALPGGGSAAVQISAPPGCTISSAQFTSTVAAGAPAGASAPKGVFSFEAAGCSNATLTVRIDYPSGTLNGLQPYKYGPQTSGAASTWFRHGTITGDSVTYTITDNGVGDSNTALGAIADPFAPLLLAATPSGVAAIPTLREWALIMLSLLTAAIGLVGLGRSRRAVPN